MVAEVPEARVGLVAAGQACVARFYAFPDAAFAGRVGSVAPTLSKERRTLRVFFELSDPQGRLEAGDVRRDRLWGPTPPNAAGPGRRRAARGPRPTTCSWRGEAGRWQVTRGQAGESDGTRVEVLDGLNAGERVIGAGAILLKPYVVEAVQGVGTPPPGDELPAG